MHSAVFPILCSYLAFYSSYRPLLTLNVEAYVGALALKGTDLSLAEISQEVATHTAQLAAMEEQLHGSISLGLIQVNCNKVRECGVLAAARPAPAWGSVAPLVWQQTSLTTVYAEFCPGQLFCMEGMTAVPG